MTRRSVVSAVLAVPLFAVAGIAYAGPATSSAGPGPSYYARYARSPARASCTAGSPPRGGHRLCPGGTSRGQAGTLYS
jgi:hypothetical protein